jgi:hypothetical protein
MFKKIQNNSLISDQNKYSQKSASAKSLESFVGKTVFRIIFFGAFFLNFSSDLKSS